MTVVLGLIVAMMSSSVFGVGFIGTPTAELEQGQWNIGANYTYMSMDLAKTKMTDGSDPVKLEISDNNIQRYYVGAGYGVTDAWEAYVQLGIADVKAQAKTDEPDATWKGLNFDNNFAWGWGTRYTFHEQDNVRWGASLQMNWLDTSWDDKSTNQTEQIDYSSYDLLFAVGPTVDMGGWNLYGGPFYYMIDGDLDSKGTGIDSWKSSGDLEEDSAFGGFVGARLGVLVCSDTLVSFTEFV